jgi:phage tail protein X
MERVTFIVSSSGERISCWLNPEHLVQRRAAGVRRPWAGSGPVTGGLLTDDVLLHTGGGRTEIDLDLLFDTQLQNEGVAMGAAVATDVRMITKQLWDLAENNTDRRDTARLDTMRVLWGKAFSYLVVVLSVAERLERFDESGTPSRSFLRLRLRRVPDPAPPPVDAVTSGLPSNAEQAAMAESAQPREFHIGLGAEVAEDGTLIGGERLDDLASRHYGNRPGLWRLIAEANGLDDAPFAPAGVPLIIPEAPPEVTP